MHLHASHATAIYLIAGTVSVLHGPGLKHRTEMVAGDYMYIPADCPHLPVNTGNVEAFAVLARTDPSEQESVVLLPSLEAGVEDRLAAGPVDEPSHGATVAKDNGALNVP